MQAASSEPHQEWSVAAEIDRLCAAEDTGEAGWLFDHRVDREQRSTVLHTVFLDSDPRWIEADHVAIDANRVTIDLSNVDGAPSSTTFEADLADEVGPDVAVVLQ